MHLCNSMFKIFTIFVGTTIVLDAQLGTCYVGSVTTGCPQVSGQNPNQKQFIDGWTTSYNTLLASIGGSTAIVVSTNIPPMIATNRGSDGANCNNASSIFSTAVSNSISIGLNTYVDRAIGNAANLGQGVSALIFNPDLTYYIEAPQYTGSATPANPALMTCQLAVDLAVVQHAVGKGLKIFISPTPSNSTWVACGLTPGSITEAQMESCLDSIEQAVAAFYSANSVTLGFINVIHEPQGIFANNSGVTLSTSDWTKLTNSICSAIFSTAPTIPCGSGMTDNDGSYITYYISNFGSHVTFIGLETYGPVLAQNYATMMNDIKTFCQSAKTAGLNCYNTEGAPPNNVPASGGTGENNVYPGMGCASQNLQTWGVNQTYAQVNCKYLSNAGFSNCTIFPSESFVAFDPNVNNNCFAPTGSVAYVMQNSIGSTAAQQSWQAGATWNGLTINNVTKLNVIIQ